MEQITPLEELLRFFHVQCRQVLNKLSVANRLTLLGLIDIVAAEAFFLAMTKGAKNVNATRECLLKVTTKFASDLGLTGESKLMREITDKPNWIEFVCESEGTQDDDPAVAGSKSAASSASKATPAVQVIQFDEASGQALNQQPQPQPQPEDTSTK